MKIKIDRSFEKDVNKIKDKNTLNKIIDCIEEIKLVASLKEVREIKKLKGFKIYTEFELENTV